MAEAYSLNVNWGEILFDRTVRDGSRDYVTEMLNAGHLTTDIFRTVVDRYVICLTTLPRKILFLTLFMFASIQGGWKK